MEGFRANPGSLLGPLPYLKRTPLHQLSSRAQAESGVEAHLPLIGSLQNGVDVIAVSFLPPL